MADVLLTVGIITVSSRSLFLERLVRLLERQRHLLPDPNSVEICINTDEQKVRGTKRNEILCSSSGHYIAFADDDDLVSENYLMLLCASLQSKVFDCASLRGLLYSSSGPPALFIHSLQYTSWFSANGVYYRCPNHLNAIRRSVCREIGYSEMHVREDEDFSIRLSKSGLLKSEVDITDILYHYYPGGSCHP